VTFWISPARLGNVLGQSRQEMNTTSGSLCFLPQPLSWAWATGHAPQVELVAPESVGDSNISVPRQLGFFPRAIKE
jgi:hypothetical protein